MVKTLLFGTMGDIGPIVLDDLVSKGYDAVLVDFPQNVFHDEWGYRRALDKAVALHCPDVVLPIGHQRAISRLKASLAAKVPVEDEEKIVLLDSKTRCSSFVARLGVPQPRIYTHPEDSVPGEVVFKRDSSFGGCGVLRPKTLQSLTNLIAHEGARPFLIQDYIHGSDVSVDCLRYGSDFKAACYQTVSKSQGQGPSSERRPVESEEIVSMARCILDSLDYNGICGMDFKVDASGNPYFLECNPRLCGGVRTQIETGFDIPVEWLLMSGCLK